MFMYSNSNKRYHTLDYYYKQKFNSKVFKISLNGGFTCPNIDGTKGIGGCIYCSSLGSGEYAGNKSDDLKTQFEKGLKMMERKWPNGKYIAYFQANTNTYANVDVLKEKYEEVLTFDNVIGLNIATRCDAITNECLEYLKELNKRTFLTIELGLQTMHDKTAKFINRGHDLKCFEEMVLKLRKNNINVVVHIINGLPNETKEMMLDTVKYLNTLDIQGIKIHMLSVLKNTKLEKIYQQNNFNLINRDEYIEIVCEQLCYLRPEIVINRITGDPKADDLIAPNWILNKRTIINDIDKYMVKFDLYQGKKIMD